MSRFLPSAFSCSSRISHALMHAHTCMHACRTHTHTHTLSLSLSLSLSHTHTHTLTHSYSLSLSHSLFLFLSCFLSLSLSFSLSLSLARARAPKALYFPVRPNNISHRLPKGSGGSITGPWTRIWISAGPSHTGSVQW